MDNNLIPTELTLGALTYNITEVDLLEDNTGLGEVISSLGKINLANTWRGEFVPQNLKERTYFHELTHAILDEIGYHKLSGDEKFIEAFSLLLHQAMKTSKYSSGRAL